MAKIPKFKKLKLKKRIKDDEPKRPKEKFSKRLKRFYRNNRIYCILMGISFLCILLVITSLVIYFLTQTSSNKYGNRLDGIKNYDTTENIKAVKEYITKSEDYEDVEIRVQGKIIYIDITVKPETSIEGMQNIAVGTLENFSQENLSYYDIQFAISRKDMKTYYGSKSSANSTITWSKYNLE